MSRDASNSAPVIQTRSKPVMLNMISFETTEQLCYVLFASTIKLILMGLNIRSLVIVCYDDRPVWFSLSKLFPVRLNMFEKLLQIRFAAHVFNRHRRLIAQQDRYMQRR